ncbi:MAG: hypothetical protein FJY29_09690 [Betaproteobacteria bacterium]|nr:hypothetical protein [Betaproteobacteria bacterium]
MRQEVQVKGSPIGLGQLLVPVKASAPTGLASGSAASSLTSGLGLAAAGQELAEVKSRIFSPGPTDFMYRLKMVDGRLAELDSRHQDSPRKCVTESAKQWALSGLPDSSNTLTGSASFWFSCKEVMSQSGGGTLTVLFGRKDGFSYVAELQKAGDDTIPTMVVLGKVDDASTKAEVWQIVLPKPSVTDTAKQHSSWMYILGDKASSNFEMAVGGTGRMNGINDSEEPNSGLGCGVRLKASSTLVSGIGRFHEAGTGGGNDATAQECNDAEVTLCAGAGDLAAKSASECTALTTFSASVPKLSYSQLKGAAPYAGYLKGKAILEMTGLPELTSFNEDASK